MNNLERARPTTKPGHSAKADAPSRKAGVNTRSVRVSLDLRSELARARDEWMTSEEGKRCAHGGAWGQYLRNRIELAWVAGAAWGQAHPTHGPGPPPDQRPHHD